MSGATVPPRHVTGAQINVVLKDVAELHPHGDIQLSILTRAIICCAKTLKVSRTSIVREIEKQWDETAPLVRRVG